MPKHSPGPWNFEGPDAFGDYNIHQPGIMAAVAAVISNLRPEEEVLHNARLVAAAPLLLEALCKAVAYLNGAKIDIQRGTPKKVALATITGGLRVVNEALASAQIDPKDMN